MVGVWQSGIKNGWANCIICVSMVVAFKLAMFEINVSTVALFHILYLLYGGSIPNTIALAFTCTLFFFITSLLYHLVEVSDRASQDHQEVAMPEKRNNCFEC